MDKCTPCRATGVGNYSKLASSDDDDASYNELSTGYPYELDFSAAGIVPTLAIKRKTKRSFTRRYQCVIQLLLISAEVAYMCRLNVVVR